ncbi:FtsX-like permease family protein [Amycolatopsis marina]|uniref:FtsX-like permease family protein n=1 Tax=Amycolatopsis marina TaxID=490629 RepID=A0A1I1AEP3_9PSEU|nr:FtsX-like permease family protein [Amycolatopsis marina]SFB36479.1 FtsX-like permease family protein [Amycolatopsis marina]
MSRSRKSAAGRGNLFADLALGLRLAVGGGRISGAMLLRLGMTTIGIALAVAVLLPAASVSNVVSEREARTAAVQADVAPRSDVDPLLETPWQIQFRDDYIMANGVAASGPNAPVPPGLDRVPDPGEMFVSPAVSELLASPDGEGLRARLPATEVGVIGKAGLVDADDLIVYTGYPVERLTAVEGVGEVYGYGAAEASFGLSGATLLTVIPIVSVLLLPLLIFVTTASRMGAAQRDRRLAALRLIGVDARRIRRIAAAESLLGAVAGLLVGGLLFLLLRPLIGNLDVFGIGLFGEDFVPSPGMLLFIVLLVPALAVGAAMFGLRRTIVEPLGVVRHSKPTRRRMWWRWLVVGTGALMTLSTLFAERGTNGEGIAYLLTAGSVLVLIGIAVVLPWAVEKLARALHGGPPSWQFAIRRLQLDSGTASRVVSGLVVVLAGTILIQVIIGSAEARATPQTVTNLPSVAPVEVTTQPEHLGEVQQRLEGVEGVDGVFPIQRAYLMSDSASGRGAMQVEIADCAALRVRAEIGPCTDGDVFAVESAVAGSGSWQEDRGIRSGQVYFESIEENGSVSRIPWTFPESVVTVPAEKSMGYYSSTFLVTPGALDDITPPDLLGTVYVSGSGSPEALSDRVAAAVAPLAWEATVWTNETPSLARQGDEELAMFRSILLGASLFVLAVAAMSLLMLSVEQITERRRALAALSASGVPISVLAKASLWQTAVPVLVGVTLAVVSGIALTAPILRLAEVSMVLDAGLIAVLSAAAVGAVLLVTLLTMPLLRQVTKLDGLRAE